MSQLYQWGLHLPPAGLYAFIFAWLFVESTGFPISDEPLLLLSGYLITLSRLDALLVILLALVGKVTASCLAYAVGHRLDLVRLARPTTRPSSGLMQWLYYLRPTKSFALSAEDLFRRRGVWGVFLGRLVPVVRSFISYPAGAARMPFPLFLTATTAGSLLWIILWTALGAALGRSYREAAARWGSLSWLVLAVLILLLAAAWRWNHRRAARAAATLHQQDTLSATAANAESEE